jgi:hypothetical protein
VHDLSTRSNRVYSSTTFISLSISRVLVKISSVLKVRISSGRSSHVSSLGTSGVTSIAARGDDAVGADESGFLFESEGGVVGGGADDILEVERTILRIGRHAYSMTSDSNINKYYRAPSESE